VYYLWPAIPDTLLNELYGKEYFTGVREVEGEIQAPSSNSDYESQFVVARLSKFRECVEELLAYHPHAHNILDIGAATGDFLAIAKEYGLSVSGIELSAYAAAKAKEKFGFVFYQSELADYHGTEKYDLIHLNHVFEHFSRPHQALDRIMSLLAPGGIVYVEVPFQFSIFEVLKYRMTGRKKQFDVFSLHHPIFYRPATLKRIFEEHGLDCRLMRVYKSSRYPAAGLVGHFKKLIWLAGSFVNQGIVIEAFFCRR
jgi:SAM-dependent methyltransferase